MGWEGNHGRSIEAAGEAEEARGRVSEREEEGRRGGKVTREGRGELEKWFRDLPAFLRLYTLEKIPSAVTRTTTEDRAT